MTVAAQPDLFDGPWQPASPAGEIPLTIRQSRRARRLALRCLPPHTLEVVVPPRTRPGEVQAFVTAHRLWIENARREIALARDACPVEPPLMIALPAIDRSWTVSYRQVPAARPGWRSSGTELVITTGGQGASAVPALLQAWLREQGRTHLMPWLERESRRTGLVPRQVQLRLQRTRWGSCSSRGVISLNAAILLLDPGRVRYLLVHELCHLREMNHSRRYWALVERYEPDWERLDRSLAGAWAELPWWVHPPA